MKSFPLISSILVVGLAIATPTCVFAHVGHGDEFQAEGGIDRVAVNTEIDSLLGIQVSPIELTADGSAAVLIPVTAVVDANGQPLVFVQYENFYEPVPIVTGATQGELIEVSEGLSVGEQLVTQGSLSLYAESRKTQTADATPTNSAADAQGIPHSQDAAGNLVETTETTPESDGFPIGLVAAAGGGAALLVGAIAFVNSNRKKKSAFCDREGGL